MRSLQQEDILDGLVEQTKMVLSLLCVKVNFGWGDPLIYIIKLELLKKAFKISSVILLVF